MAKRKVTEVSGDTAYNLLWQRLSFLGRNAWMQKRFPEAPESAAVALTLKLLCERFPSISPSEFRKMRATELIEYLREIDEQDARDKGGGKPNKGKQTMLTEPLSKTKLGGYFACHRNDVKEKVLDRYVHETVGKGNGERYRMRVADMPTDYHVKHKAQ